MEPTREEFVANALDFASENRGPFDESDVAYVIDDTRRRKREGNLPTLPKRGQR
jgi:hypothetical protein